VKPEPRFLMTSGHVAAVTKATLSRSSGEAKPRRLELPPFQLVLDLGALADVADAASRPVPKLDPPKSS